MPNRQIPTPLSSSLLSPWSLIKYWLPVAVYAIFIFYISSIPGKDIPSLFPYQDVFWHILEYLFFGLLIVRAFKGSLSSVPLARRVVLIVIIGLLYALSDEFHQRFVPGRSCSLFDLGNDCIGIFLALLIYR